MSLGQALTLKDLRDWLNSQPEEVLGKSHVTLYDESCNCTYKIRPWVLDPDQSIIIFRK